MTMLIPLLAALAIAALARAAYSLTRLLRTLPRRNADFGLV
jgi:hypothetical protein